MLSCALLRADELTPLQARWNWNDPELLIPSREQFAGSPIRLFISLSGSIDSPCLPVVVRPFMLPNQKDQGGQGIHRLGIVADEHPGEELLYRWMTHQIQSETATDFETQMDKLLLSFVSGQKNAIGQPFEALLANILRMRCMWKVWSCKQLYHRGREGVPGIEFDFRLASIQDSLRLHAAQVVSELERKIVADVETHILKKDTGRAAPPMRSRIDIAKWLLLWQTILIYRQSLSWMLQQQQTNHAAPIPISG